MKRTSKVIAAMASATILSLLGRGASFAAAAPSTVSNPSYITPPPGGGPNYYWLAFATVGQINTFYDNFAVQWANSQCMIEMTGWLTTLP
jgi:hypothetical protein